MQRLRIKQTGPEEWHALAMDHYSPGVHRVLGIMPTYDQALESLIASAEFQTIVAAASEDQGLLPEHWTSVRGIAFSEATGDGRDFSACTWSGRDPSVSLLPLMLQTETEIGHFGAELAGFIYQLDGLGYRGTPDAMGRFYATDCGVQFRDMLHGNRVFGVSVDAGPGTEATFECTQYDEEFPDWCVDGVLNFSAYEVIGLTGTPFPAFANAAIQLFEPAVAEPAPAAAPMMAMAAAGGPVRPSRTVFEVPEPELGDERLIDQGGGALAMPFTISDDGTTCMGHLTYWGQCHVGFANQCVSAPESASAYAHYHVGDLITEEGDHLAVGTLFAGTDHADITWGAAAAIDHYAHTGVGWANVRVSNGQFGAWACGSIRPGLTDAQLAVVRASPISGDWRRLGGHLELIAGLSVNSTGFPIVREALAASGLAMADERGVRARLVGGEQVSLLAASIVRQCPECAKRAQLARGAARGGQDGSVALLAELREMRRDLTTIERRTRHLGPAAIEYAASRFAVPN